jgi:N-acetyl-gamma-glutamyl-phosphate reductase
VELTYVISHSQSGKISEIHRDLEGDTDLDFSELGTYREVDVVFLCMGHGKSREFFNTNEVFTKTKYIDLSQDFRHKTKAGINGSSFVYGLSELNKKEIAKAQFVANPGCFATAIELALLPLKYSGYNSSIHVHAITGSTGAGQSPSDTTHFSWRNNNVSIYKPFTHQHKKEIKETLGLDENDPGFHFIPVRGNFTRGIFCTAYTQTSSDIDDIKNEYLQLYGESAFVKILDRPVDLKEVVNTNKCHIHLQKEGDVLLVTSVIDNLLKGASGQAVQNMNIMFGLEESTGLHIKSSYF